MIVQGWLRFIQSRRFKRRLVRLARQVRSAKLKVFGIKVWYGEAFTWSKFLVDQIHRYHPECIVIAGGYHVSLYQADVLKYSHFDLAVVHEGETALTAILDTVDSVQQQGRPWNKKQFIQQLTAQDKRSQLPGLIYRIDGEYQSIPPTLPPAKIGSDKAIPSYEPDDGKTRIHILMDSLGCPWSRCYFCVHNQFTPIHRTRDVGEIVTEIKSMARQGIGLFRFSGSDTPLYQARKIATAILENHLVIEFAMGARVVKNCQRPQTFQAVVAVYTTCLKAG
jgi:radical SAM superfamily enzyme YgiQ (UPF0313 family)